DTSGRETAWRASARKRGSSPAPASTARAFPDGVRKVQTHAIGEGFGRHSVAGKGSPPGPHAASVANITNETTSFGDEVVVESGAFRSSHENRERQSGTSVFLSSGKT